MTEEIGWEIAQLNRASLADRRRRHNERSAAGDGH